MPEAVKSMAGRLAEGFMTTNYTPLRSRKPLPDMSALNGSQLKRLGGTGAKLGCCVVSADGSLVFANA